MIGSEEISAAANLSMPMDSTRSAGAASLEELPASLRVERCGDLIRLSPRGDWRPEILLESMCNALVQALAARRGCSCLEVDLALMAWLDDLGVSAVVVVLRGQAGSLERITLSGLPGWAQARLQRAGARHLLGPKWISHEEGDAMVFTRG